MYNSTFFEAVEDKDAKKLYGILPDITLDQLFMKKPRHYGNERLTAPEIAAKEGHQEILCQLINHAVKLGADANSFDTAIIKTLIYNQPDCFLLLINDPRLQFTSWHLLEKAVRSNFPQRHFRILLEHPVSSQIPSEVFGELVKELARTDNASLLEILLKHPVSLQIPSEVLGEAIQKAGKYSFINLRYETLHLLLQNADKNTQLLSIYIIEIIRRNDEYKLLVLLQHASEFEISHQCIEKAIIEAAKRNAVGILNLLLQHASKFEISHQCIEKAIIEAASQDAIGILNLLLQHASELKNLPECIEKAIHASELKNLPECIEKAIHASELKNLPECIEKAIIEAAGRNALGTLILLLQHASKLKISPQCIEKAIIEAAGRDAVGTLILLLPHASELNISPECIEKAIIEAAKQNSVGTLSLLLQHADKFKLNISSQYISKAVNQALLWNTIGTLSLLLQYVRNLNISIQYIGKNTIRALRFATEKGITDKLRVLLDYATELGISPEWIPDAAWQAAKKKDSICFSLLVGSDKVNLNAQEKITGMTATMFVARQGNFMQLKSLIEKKVKLNITSKKGKSAISLAAEEGNFMCIALLLAENVKVSKEDIALLKQYKEKLFNILANDFVYLFDEKKSNKALLKAFLKKDSALHQVFSAPIGLTACSTESGTLGKIRDVLLERKVIRRTATSASLSHTTLFGKGGSTKLGTSEKNQGDIELKELTKANATTPDTTTPAQLRT